MSRKFLIMTYAILVVALLLAPVISQAGTLRYGLRGGLSLSDTSEDTFPTTGLEDQPNLDVTYDTDFRNGFTVGGFVEYWFNTALALQLNVLYTQKGTNINATADGEVYDAQSGFTVSYFQETSQTMETNYVSVPILAKYAFGDELSPARPFLIVGPELNFLESARAGEITGGGFAYFPGAGGAGFDVDLPSTNIKDETESFEAAICIGTGIDFRMGTFNAFVDGRYALGLTKTNKEGDGDYKNNVFYINVGLLF